ncbi:helix-turn-helix domain-containing protein [Listeria booriae]|uniref:helix-turn-helix domain-containing protein n=1 Tax=Listeria booriae TaxID=1552123 RepID=UPI00162551A5|nr:helix-turn-helix transcriptional regulator [Listeria booriae]MBC2256977.1 helix-turn-helix transcriptional regulator [Listeria booriae]
MKKKLGDTLKEIRINQGLKQKDLFDEFLPRGTLQKIESNERVPAYDRLQYIARKLNTTISEIEFLQNHKQLSKVEKIIFDYRNLKHSIYTDDIKNLLTRMEKYLDEAYDQRIFELKAILEAMLIINNTQDYQAPVKKVQFIWERLEKQDEWLSIDMLILAHIFFIFPTYTARQIINRLVINIESYVYFQNNKRLQLGLYLNIASYLKSNFEIVNSEEYIVKAIELARESENLVLETVANYRFAEVLLIKGEKKKALDIAENSFAILKLAKRNKLLDDIKGEWQQINENINDYTST